MRIYLTGWLERRHARRRLLRALDRAVVAIEDVAALEEIAFDLVRGLQVVHSLLTLARRRSNETELDLARAVDANARANRPLDEWIAEPPTCSDHRARETRRSA